MNTFIQDATQNFVDLVPLVSLAGIYGLGFWGYENLAVATWSAGLIWTTAVLFTSIALAFGIRARLNTEYTG